MKNFSQKKTFFTFSLLLSISLMTACGPATIPPPPDISGGGIAGDGSSLEYPAQPDNIGFSEDNLPLEGSLDDNAPPEKSSYGFPAGFNPDDQSSEYRKAHGRCTPGMAPIYFPFDQARITQDMLVVAEQNIAFLQENPGVHVVLEGNSDQRGTNEYNMALAERRAINVQQYLTSMGINPSRIRTVSYGEERPLFLEHSEEAYKYNRRVDFVAE